MALSEPIKNLLASLKDPTRREQMTKAFEEEALLQEAFAGNLRQSDYDRQMNQAKKDREDIEAKAKKLEVDLQAAQRRADEADGISKKWVDWKNINEPRHQKLLEEHKTVTQANAKLVADIEKLKLEGVDVDQQELTNIVNQRVAQFEAQYGDRPNRDQVATIVQESMTKMVADLEAKFNGVMPGWSKFNLDMGQAMISHNREFGEDLNREELIKFMNAEQILDVTKGYPRFVETRRAAAAAEEQKKKTQAEIDAAVKDALSKANVPGSGVVAGSPGGELGVLQRKQQNAQMPEIPADAMVGDGRLAAAAAAALRSEGRV